MSAGHLCFAFAFRGSLHIGCIVIGLCYGVHWSVMPATVSELFGLQHFGVLFNVVATSMPLGSFLFSSLIAGSLYDYEAEKSRHGPTLRHLLSFFGGSRLAHYGDLQPLELYRGALLLPHVPLHVRREHPGRACHDDTGREDKESVYDALRQPKRLLSQSYHQVMVHRIDRTPVSFSRRIYSLTSLCCTMVSPVKLMCCCKDNKETCSCNTIIIAIQSSIC